MTLRLPRLHPAVIAIGYNPRADESDYDDNETPDIVDLYGDEVYNNID